METCEVDVCYHKAVNVCAYCSMPICMNHSFDAISDEGHDVYACPYCYNELIACYIPQERTD